MQVHNQNIMRKIRFILTILSLVFAARLSVAQNSPKADRAIKDSQKKFNSLKDLSSEFTYTLKNPNLGEPIVKKGKILFSKNKYHITFPDEEMICNGTFIWMVLKEEKEVTKQEFNPNESLSPEKMYKIYEKDTKSRFDGEENGNEKVTLFASNDKGDIWKTELWIEIKTKLISKAVMHARNGSSYEYQMNSIKTDIGIPISSFEVDEGKYKAQGFIITDLTE